MPLPNACDSTDVRTHGLKRDGGLISSRARSSTTEGLLAKGLCWSFYRFPSTRALWLDLYMRCGGCPGWNAVPTHLSTREKCALFWIGAALARASVVVEFGSYLGASSIVLAAAVSRRGGRICCVDSWCNDAMSEGPRDTWEEFSRNTQAFADSICALRQPTAETTIDQLPRPASLAFIDADHSYRGVQADVHTALNLMHKGGSLLFHDATVYPGVSRVIGELLATGEWKLARLFDTLAWLQPVTWQRSS